MVCPTSSGGTHAGLLAGIPPLFPRTQVLGVGVGDDPEEVLEAVGTLKDALGDLLDLPPRDEGFREAFCFDYGFGDYGALAGPVMDLIRDVASREGFFLDPVYTGKAFYGLRDRIRRGIVHLRLPGALRPHRRPERPFPVRGGGVPALPGMTPSKR